MKLRHIEFEVIVADFFYFPESDRTTLLHLWPHPGGKSEELIIPISFEWDKKSDVMKEAERELDKYIREHYPNKDYKIYYWWWKD